jgi:hypothetical protein
VRGRLFGALLAATLFTALTGTAHAGYAYMETYSNDFDPIFYAGPGESPDLQFQVTDDLTSVVFEDRRNPITVGRPPVDEHDLNDGDTRYPEDREPCEPLSRHKVRCTGPPGFTVSQQRSATSRAGAVRSTSSPGLSTTTSRSTTRRPSSSMTPAGRTEFVWATGAAG